MIFNYRKFVSNKDRQTEYRYFFSKMIWFRSGEFTASRLHDFILHVNLQQ